MKKINLVLPLFFFILFIENTGCKKEPVQINNSGSTGGTGGPGGSGGTGGNNANSPPIARAGNDTTIQLPWVSVILNGTNSYDPDNNIKSYLWLKISGPASGNIQGVNQALASMVNMYEAGIYRFELKVTDSEGLFSADTVQVTVDKISLASYCQANRDELTVSVNELSNMPGQIRWPIMFNIDNKLVVVATSFYDSEKTINVYDKTTMQWRTSVVNSNLITDGWSVIAAAGNKLFFAGGGVTTNPDNTVITSSRIDIYDIVTNTWSATNLSESRAFVNVVVAGNKVFFAGGMKADRSFSNRVDILDMSTNDWSTSQLAGTPRVVSSSTVANNKIYFCGGYTEFKWNGGWQEDLGAVVGVIDVYDLTTGQWSIEAMNKPKEWFGTISKNGIVYLAGGYGTYDVDVINTTSNQRSISCLSAPDIFTSKNVTSFNNWLIFYGDHGYVGSIKERLELYNTQSGKWAVGLLPSGMLPDGYWTSIVADDNKIYMAANGKLYVLNF